MCERAPHIIVCYGEKLKYEREKKIIDPTTTNNHRPSREKRCFNGN